MSPSTVANAGAEAVGWPAALSWFEKANGGKIIIVLLLGFRYVSGHGLILGKVGRSMLRHYKGCEIP
jgi:hypothetical protein